MEETKAWMETVGKPIDGEEPAGNGAVETTAAQAPPASNQRAIDLLTPIANGETASPGQVLVLVWHWKGVGVNETGSVGHVAVAVFRDGKWEIVQSQFPDPHATQGVNTTIRDPDRLKAAEGGRLPSAAYLVDVKNMGAYARAAIQDLKQPTWATTPGAVCTNCTVGVMRSLRAGGVLVGQHGLSPSMAMGGVATPGRFEESLRFKASHPGLSGVHAAQRNDLIQKFDWNGEAP